MKISIIGPGCPSCKNLHESVLKIVKDKKIDAVVEYSNDMSRIVELGLMYVPVFLIDGKVIKLKNYSDEEIINAINGNPVADDGGCSGCSCGGKC